MLVDGKYEIKKETKWNYQIQGLMGITGIHRCDLVIYTLKGILIVNVKFDSDLWNEMLQKLETSSWSIQFRNYSTMTYLSHYRVTAIRR